jgi:hypothetical protein
MGTSPDRSASSITGVTVRKGGAGHSGNADTAEWRRFQRRREPAEDPELAQHRGNFQEANIFSTSGNSFSALYLRFGAAWFMWP